MSKRCLDIVDLHVHYPDGSHVLRGVSLSVEENETVALVGESGCGKTTLANAVVASLPRRCTVQGSITLHGIDGPTDVLRLAADARRALSGRRIGYVPQNPYGACDPLRSVAHHVESAWRVHGLRPPPGAVETLIEGLGVNDAGRRIRHRPHTWSGGMLQRASIGGGSALRPELLVADEPTSALDADLARSTLGTLQATGCAILLITHDLVLAAEVADRIYVLYGGRVLEVGQARSLLERPAHPYSRALRDAVPTTPGVLPAGLKGDPPSPRRIDRGCVFAPRCSHRVERCDNEVPVLVDGVACVLTEKPHELP